MTERECQARLHPHTGSVEASPQLTRERKIAMEETIDALWDKLMLRSRALMAAERTLKAIAEEKTLAGVMAKSTLEQIEAVSQPPPKLCPVDDIEEMRR